MKKPPHVIEIFLQPGEHYSGNRDTRIRTLLGSCVAIAMWHPKHLVGGMCHYMLPRRTRRGPSLDGKYADEALELLLDDIRRVGTTPGEYQIKLFGGGNMFPGNDKQHARHVGFKNIEAARVLLKQHGLAIHAEHLGGEGHRNVLFDLWSGHVWMKHQSLTSPNCENCEAGPICRQNA